MPKKLWESLLNTHAVVGHRINIASDRIKARFDPAPTINYLMKETCCGCITLKQRRGFHLSCRHTGKNPRKIVKWINDVVCSIQCSPSGYRRNPGELNWSGRSVHKGEHSRNCWPSLDVMLPSVYKRSVSASRYHCERRWIVEATVRVKQFD